ncbi:hypothetical protein J7643_16890 [bacterium]|nr:hypothetical protein [bacterium]
MKTWIRAALAGSMALALAACGGEGPAGTTLPGDDVPHEVTAEYTPGEVSTSPSIEQARAGIVASTLAGTGVEGSLDGAGTSATFKAPEGLAVAADGTLYVAEPYAYRIRKISPSGQVSTFVGGQSEQPGRADGLGKQAQFMGPKDVAIAPSGDLYVADFDAVRKISPSGQVSTLALKNPDGSAYDPIELFGIAIDASSNLYVSSTYWIDKISPQGVVTRYAGNEGRGFADGPGARSYFNLPRKLAFDGAGNLYVADYGNLRIRRIAPDRTVKTIAGNGILGFTDGDTSHSRLNFPMGLAVDASGRVIVADTYNHAVREIGADGRIRTVAGNNWPGFTDGTGAIQFRRPGDIAIAPNGAILVADIDNARIRVLR